MRALSTCGLNGLNGAIFEGYFTNFNGGAAADDSIFIVISNDDFSYTGVLTCDVGLGNCW